MHFLRWRIAVEAGFVELVLAGLHTVTGGGFAELDAHDTSKSLQEKYCRHATIPVDWLIPNLTVVVAVLE
jgi:hypothetical protein